MKGPGKTDVANKRETTHALSVNLPLVFSRYLKNLPDFIISRTRALGSEY